MARYGRRVSRDPYWLTLKYAATQPDGTKLPAGTKVWYYPNTKTMLAGEAATDAANAFQAACDDEATYSAGYGV